MSTKNLNTVVDTVTIPANSKTPFLDVRLDEFDANNIVMNTVLTDTPRNTKLRFSYVYYMKDGVAHRFTLVVHGVRGNPIDDLNFVEMESSNDDGIVRKEKRAVLDVTYEDKIHKSIIDTLLSVHSRILDIIARNPEFTELVFEKDTYDKHLIAWEKIELASSEDELSELEESFWREKLEESYPATSFISKTLFKTTTKTVARQIREVIATDSDGSPIVNDTFPVFLNYRERRKKDSDEMIGVMIDKSRKTFLFDELKGLRGTLAKLSLDIGMVTLTKVNKIKIHKTVVGGFLMALETRGGAISDKYMDDIDPSLMRSEVVIPRDGEEAEEDSESEYDDDMIDV